jgi:hypothetical protein
LKLTLLSLAAALGIVCGTASAAPPGSTTAAVEASAPASGAVRATRAASAACGMTAASAPVLNHAPTSKVRHVPDEGDPCADSRGVGMPLPR